MEQGCARDACSWPRCGSRLLPLRDRVAQRPASLPATCPSTPGTFSILGFDPETGEIGAAVQSRVFSVGNGVLWAEAGVGAVATQAIVDVSYGPKGIALLKQGLAPDEIIKRILDEDPDPGYRGSRGRRPAVSLR